MNRLLIFSLALTGAAKSQVATDTYKGCEFPEFEWAAYGTRLTGRMYTRKAAILGDSLYAAGYLKSTNAPNKENFVDTDTDFGVTGPYTTKDPTGAKASSITSDLVSYTTEYGTFAQYEVGVVKINTKTGKPEDVFVYYGEGQDETCGLAARKTSRGRGLLAVSGHFVGRLTADHGDGTSTTVFNSNGEGNADYVQHPNSIKNGFDDGFVISADAKTGAAKWLVRYPKSNRDAETVGVDIDGEGNVYGSGYECNEKSGTTTCDGFVAKFRAKDGEIMWVKKYPELGAAMWLVYDDEDDALYVTGTTTYKGIETPDKDHPHCDYDVCAVAMRISASDGSTHWIRTVEGSPRWNYFDQSGDIKIASKKDGPYVYVAVDDAGENGRVTVDGGTPYAGCDFDGYVLPEYKIGTTKTITQDDCSGGTFVPRTSEDALPASKANTEVYCGAGHDAVDACIIKFHKYTGLPVWANDVPPIASLVPAADGKSVMAVGFYYPSWGHFDSVTLPDYNGVEGVYNAKMNAETGEGEYVMHSGGTYKDRAYDAVGSPEGDVYMVGYTQSEVINWGGTLTTKIVEEGVDQNDDVGTAFQMGNMGSKTSEYQFFAVKLAASKGLKAPSCVTRCGGDRDKARVARDTCFIDNVCYNSGESAENMGRPCLVCDPGKSQTAWSVGPTVGSTQCFIDNVCRNEGVFLTYRESRRVTHTSSCQVCDPSGNPTGWSVTSGFKRVDDTNPPDDCKAN